MGYQLIETIEVGSGGAASIEFTGIPQDGVDLQLVISDRGDRADNILSTLALTLNSASTNYSDITLRGTGTAVSSFSATAAYIRIGSGPQAPTTANTFGNTSVYISNYSEAVSKSVSSDCVFENNASAADQRIVAASWNDTTAVTSLQIFYPGLNFVQYSTASLYKITAD